MPSVSLPAITHCIVEKNGSMNSFFWLSRFWRMPSDTDTVERFSSSTPSAMPLTYSTTSGLFAPAFVLALAPPARSPLRTVTSSATAKSLASASAQFTNHTVTVFAPTSGRSFTP